MSQRGNITMTPAAIAAHAKKHGHALPAELADKNAITMPLLSRRKLKKHREPNQAERDFGLRLEAMQQRGDIEYYGFEEITLRWADLAYTPDYFVIRHSRFFETVRTSSDSKEPELVSDTDRRLIEAVYIELKGAHKWEDSVIKWKTAKERFSWATFQMWQRISGNWEQVG